jgi:UDP:flavonoid glycosyltransferase YjiC (YdhE family)
MTTQTSLAFVFPLVNLGGNVPPILAVAAELTRRGHVVRVVVPDCGDQSADDRMRRRIAEAGALLVPRSVRWRDGFVPPRPQGLIAGRTGKFFGPLSDTYGVYVQSHAWAQAISEVLHEHTADVVATDVLLPGALIAAEAHGCGSAVLMHAILIFRPLEGRPPPGVGFMPARTWYDRLRDRLVSAAIMRAHWRDALPFTNHARRAFGLPHLRRPFEEFDRADRFLVMASPHVDFLPSRPPSNVVYTGFVNDNFSHDATWEWPWKQEDDRPVVLVTMSTNDQGQFTVLQRLLDAVGRLPVRVLVSTGPSLRGRKLHAPQNVELQTWVPHDDVLPRVRLVIAHGGHGTTMKSLTAGVPVLCVPLTADQPDIAARIVARGVGARLSRRSSPARIRTAIMSLLHDETVQRRVRDLAAHLRLENGVHAAADELERVGLAARAL